MECVRNVNWKVQTAQVKTSSEALKKLIALRCEALLQTPNSRFCNSLLTSCGYDTRLPKTRL
jgi:hypothetical protein